MSRVKDMKKIGFLLILISATVACNKKSDIEDSEMYSFPVDTVVVNTLWKSSIDYENINHDKFTEILNTEPNLRWIIAYYTLDTIPYLEKEIFENRQDSVLGYDPHKINLRDMKFEKTGTYYISGIIKDNIVLDSVWVNGMKNTQVSEAVFWRKIIVKE